ncbi:DUF87 domain-containing protein [uncultured Sphingomonas sp.]|uniref:ATP-binding protein n=1 Tax=uncultured Sphingomonas sp. TaxID=158754 RepID=UPI0025E9C486|nr:DUF87 domain-containing protein [uncultured Sphingomonas sp.]
MGMHERFVSAITAGDAMELGRLVAIGGHAAEITVDVRMLQLVRGSGGGSIGSHVKLRLGRRWVVGQIRTLRLSEADGDLVVGTLEFCGEGDDVEGELRNFRRGVTRLPLPGCALHGVSADELSRIFAPDGRPYVEIGDIAGAETQRACLTIDPLLGRHFAVLGSTGTGKSSATALILHRIRDAAPRGHVVMIDPHGEYAASFSDSGAIFDAANLATPYWMMNLDEHAEVLLTSSGNERQVDRDVLARVLLAARAKHRAADGMTRMTADTPTPYLLSDFGAILQQEMGRLDKGGVGAAPYLRIKARMDEVKADPRYAFMFSGMLVGDTMADVLQRLLRLDKDGTPIAIVDLSGMPSEITGVIVALLGRLIFDHAMWSRGLDQRPVLLVCEEAHRYIPAEGPGPARAVLERIAKEGRKYGVALGLVTQRPSDLAPGVLSQCGTIVAMRLNNDRDQAHVRAAMPEGSGGLADAIPALRNREAVIVGEGAPLPIRVCFDPLDADRLPASYDPVFSQAWAADGRDERLRTERAVHRWRTQGR